VTPGRSLHKSSTDRFGAFQACAYTPPDPTVTGSVRCLERRRADLRGSAKRAFALDIC
jgi:hypothetical protein